MRAERRLEFRVGLFIAASGALLLLGIWMLGSTQGLFSRHDAFFIRLPDAGGIVPGAKVTISGVNAGAVDSFALSSQDGSVRVKLSIAGHFEDSLRGDSFAEVITEGVLGDKVIAVAAGTPSYAKLPPGSEIAARSGSNLKTLLGKSDALASRLSTLAKDLDQLVLEVDHQVKGDHLANSLEKLDSILGKIDQGNGTLGGLVNDTALYDDVKALIGESNHNRIVRNLVRQMVKDGEAKGPG